MAPFEQLLKDLNLTYAQEKLIMQGVQELLNDKKGKK